MTYPHDRLKDIIRKAVDQLIDEGRLPQGVLEDASLDVQQPKNSEHGDYASNVALMMMKRAGVNGREISAMIAEKVKNNAEIDSVETAGPGFINVRFSDLIYEDVIRAAAFDEDYGRRSSGERILVEYVSANPTGPIHVGHARGAVIGSAISNLLTFLGNDVRREYYVNDAGGQIEGLAKSVRCRYMESLGLPFDEDDLVYPGSYLVEVGQSLADQFGDVLTDVNDVSFNSVFAKAGVEACMRMIKENLDLLGVEFDVFFEESSITQDQRNAAYAGLTRDGMIIEGVLPRLENDGKDEWEERVQPIFLSSKEGDDQDRALTRKDGSPTYFANDVVHHAVKITEGHDRLINVLGEDHSGYVKRITAAVKALSGGRVSLETPVVNMVRIMKDGQPFRMSKRLDNFVTLEDLINEVGPDVTRMVMLSKSPNTTFDFDVSKVSEGKLDDPVWNINYAHARTVSLLDKAEKAGFSPSEEVSVDSFQTLQEKSIIKRLMDWPRLVEVAGRELEPHRLMYYAIELSADFNSFWTAGNSDDTMRVINPDDPDLTIARLTLAKGVQNVLRNALMIAGIEAMKRMDRIEPTEELTI